MERMSSARSTGMFLGSPPPMKKWHLSAQAPQRTQMSMNSLSERYLSRRSRKPLTTISFQLGGSCQSASEGFQVRGLPNTPGTSCIRYSTLSSLAG